MAPEQVLRTLNMSLLNGLSDSQVAGRVARFGVNVLSPPKKRPLLLQFFMQLFAGFGPLLWVAATLCFMSWQPLGESDPDPSNLALSLVLVVVIFLQAIFSLYQELSSRNMMESISGMVPTQVSLRRNGKWDTYRAADLVLGDIVKLEAGMRVPADMRIVESTELKLDTSGLTGESIPIVVDTAPQSDALSVVETPNLALFGTTVVDGTGTAVVVAISDKTEL